MSRIIDNGFRQHWSGSLSLGDIISLQDNDGNEYLRYLVSIHIDYKDNDLNLKLSNKKTNIDEGQRYLPLDNKLLVELIEIIEEQKRKKITNIRGLLFWDYTNNDFVTPSEINSWLLRLNEKYKICKSSLSSHRLRHTALTHWRNKGIPMSVIQYLAGHVEGSKITQDVYIDTSIEYVEDELKKIV